MPKTMESKVFFVPPIYISSPLTRSFFCRTLHLRHNRAAPRFVFISLFLYSVGYRKREELLPRAGGSGAGRRSPERDSD